jgi:hypothetical protein
MGLWYAIDGESSRLRLIQRAMGATALDVCSPQHVHVVVNRHLRDPHLPRDPGDGLAFRKAEADLFFWGAAGTRATLTARGSGSGAKPRGNIQH